MQNPYQNWSLSGGDSLFIGADTVSVGRIDKLSALNYDFIVL